MHSKQSIFYLLEFIQLNFIPIYLQLIGYQFLKAPDCVETFETSNIQLVMITYQITVKAQIT